MIVPDFTAIIPTREKEAVLATEARARRLPRRHVEREKPAFSDALPDAALTRVLAGPSPGRAPRTPRRAPRAEP